VPIFLLLALSGLSDNPLGVILPSMISPIGVYLMRVYIEQGVDEGLLDESFVATRVEGRDEFQAFVQVFAPEVVSAACGVTAVVRSPTYTLVEHYDLGANTAVHLDLYRLQDASELEALGVRDWAQPGYLWLIEWPERAGGRLPPPDLCVGLAAGADAHQIVVTAATPLAKSWLSRV